MEKNPLISVVVPVYNEEESLDAFYAEATRVMPSLSSRYEIVFVDDGSTDKSLSMLQDLVKKDKRVKAFSFRKNMGKAEALTLGFQKSDGDYIVTLDADLQDKPTEIHKLLKKCQSGTDVVSGWRRDRKDKSKMVAISRIFNKIMNYLFGLSLHDYNCGLKMYKKDAAKSLRLYGGLHRFIPLISQNNGFSVDEVVVEHAPRMQGTSKYGFSKLWKELPDMFTVIFIFKYSKRPMHFFGIIGGICTIIGGALLVYLTLLRLSGQSIGTRPLLTYAVLLIVGGLQIFSTGFIADLLLHMSYSQPMEDDKPIIFPLKYSSEAK